MSIIPTNMEHGIVCNITDSVENYFGWPSVAKLEDGTIVAGASGLRRGHGCPWGKSVLCYSTDGGKTYGAPQIAHNDLSDNRDLGVIAMGGQTFAITWFSDDTRQFTSLFDWMSPENKAEALAYIETWDKDTLETLLGSWAKITEDGGKTWTRAIRVPVSAPHGFTVLSDGTLGYLGKGFDEKSYCTSGKVRYAVSQDGGFTWQIRCDLPISDEDNDLYHEPHVIELDDGTLMGVIRYHIPKAKGSNLDTCLSFSRDGGYTWTEPVRMNVAGSPPHLLKHSSGAIVMVYGYRHPGAYGQRAVVSRDNGQTWSDEIILRDDGPSGDLGYPASIELDDGSIYTVYYQELPGQNYCSLLWTKWELPV